jgi:hypothetical protein
MKTLIKYLLFGLAIYFVIDNIAGNIETNLQNVIEIKKARLIRAFYYVFNSV